MAYQGNQINYNNLNEDLKVKIDKAEDINAIKTKVDNSWQKGVYNDTDIMNLGDVSHTKVFGVNAVDWKSTSNTEVLSIVFPNLNVFSGIIKLNVASNYNFTDAGGGATVEYTTQFYMGTIHKYSKTITSVSPTFAKNYYLEDLVLDITDKHLVVPIFKAPTANNAVFIEVSLIGINIPNDVMSKAHLVTYDSGSPTGLGYPWPPQKSQIPTNSKMNFWDTSMWNDIIDGRTFTFAGGTHNVAQFSPEQFRNVLDSYLVNKMGTFKCLLPSSDLGLTNLMDMYGILTTIKPWTDESGGGLKQRFETSDVIFKRYQINATTWSAWVCMQSKDVDIIKLFQSASDVKKNVAQAITDKGVPTSPDATGAQMANNIRAIQTIGGASGNGTANGAGYTTTFSATGLAFQPRVINIYSSNNGARVIYNPMVNWQADVFAFDTVSQRWHNYIGANVQILPSGFVISVPVDLTGSYRWEAFK